MMVVVCYSLLCNSSISHSHSKATMPEKFHDGHKAHARVDELCCVSVTKTMRNDGSRDVEAGADFLRVSLKRPSIVLLERFDSMRNEASLAHCCCMDSTGLLVTVFCSWISSRIEPNSGIAPFFNEQICLHWRQTDIGDDESAGWGDILLQKTVINRPVTNRPPSRHLKKQKQVHPLFFVASYISTEWDWVSASFMFEIVCEMCASRAFNGIRNDFPVRALLNPIRWEFNFGELVICNQVTARAVSFLKKKGPASRSAVLGQNRVCS